MKKKSCGLYNPGVGIFLMLVTGCPNLPGVGFSPVHQDVHMGSDFFTSIDNGYGSILYTLTFSRGFDGHISIPALVCGTATLGVDFTIQHFQLQPRQPSDPSDCQRGSFEISGLGGSNSAYSTASHIDFIDHPVTAPNQNFTITLLKNIYTLLSSRSVFSVNIIHDQLMSCADNISRLNPLAWYRLDETSGEQALDSSGHGFHATHYRPAPLGPTLGVEGVTYTQDDGRAVTYSAWPMSYTEVRATDPRFLEDSWSVITFVKIDPNVNLGANMAIFGLWDHSVNAARYGAEITGSGPSGENFFFQCGANFSNHPSCMTGSSNWADPLDDITRGVAGYNLNDGKWHLVACTFDGTAGELKNFVDGKQVGPSFLQDQSVCKLQGPATFRFGSDDREYDQFKGAMDEMQVYNRALSENEISKSFGACVNP